mmetsp:Transcript_96736/g.273285  ORF Transcript_96736/g.273285 Transcript_96736/m.273285 type:complete len:273 (-) Transcript_96736:252-1070(-)
MSGTCQLPRRMPVATLRRCRPPALLAAVVVTAAVPIAAEASSLGAVRGALAGRRDPVDDEILFYRKRAKGYERAALEAEQAAAKYVDMAKAAAVRQSTSETAATTRQELARIGVDRVARAVAQTKSLLADPRPAAATLAADSARVPYDERYKEYADSQDSYALAADTYEKRAHYISDEASRLEAYARQERADGDASAADSFDVQARQLSTQSDTLKDLSSEYSSMAGKLKKALPRIKGMAEHAAKFAAYTANPERVPGPGDVEAFTPAPAVL